MQYYPLILSNAAGKSYSQKKRETAKNNGRDPLDLCTFIRRLFLFRILNILERKGWSVAKMDLKICNKFRKLICLDVVLGLRYSVIFATGANTLRILAKQILPRQASDIFDMTFTNIVEV